MNLCDVRNKVSSFPSDRPDISLVMVRPSDVETFAKFRSAVAKFQQQQLKRQQGASRSETWFDETGNDVISSRREAEVGPAMPFRNEADVYQYPTRSDWLGSRSKWSAADFPDSADIDDTNVKYWM